MQSNLVFDPHLSAEELRGFSRTVAEIEWLLLILVLLYQVVLAPNGDTAAALGMAMFFFAAFILGFHYANFYRKETYWKLAIETWAMIVFITWVLLYTGRLESPLLNLYLLVIITSALTLGKLSTLMQMALISACYVWLGHPERIGSLPITLYLATLATQLAPLLLVAYITTMLSADIRRALMQVKLLSETDDLTGALNMRAFNSGLGAYFQAFRALLALFQRADDRFRQPEISQRRARPRSRQPSAENDRTVHPEPVCGIPTTSRVTAATSSSCCCPKRPAAALPGSRPGYAKQIEAMALATRTEPVRTTISIGIACYPEHGSNLDIVLEKADLAMYASKADGKNRTTVYGNK